MLFIEFIMVVAIVVYCATKLSNEVEVIEANSKINVIVAGAILAAATSLPELATSITSAAIGQSAMSISNVLGSNIFNLIILAVMNIIFFKDVIYHKISSDANKINIYVILMYIVVTITMLISFSSSFRMNLGSILLLVIYIFGMRAVSRVELNSEGFAESEVDHNKRNRAILMFVIYAIIVLFASIFLSTIAEQIMYATGLDASFVGAIFIGVSTSLPELVSCYALCKNKQYDMATVGIIGSCLFNFTILFVVDLIDAAPLLVSSDGIYLLIAMGVAFTVMTMTATYMKFKLNFIIPSIMVFMYGCFIVLGG